MSPAAELRRELDLVGARLVVTEGGERSRPVARELGTPVLDSLDSDEVAPIRELDRDAIAVVIFSSGTAGAPRAAMRTHGNLLVNIEQVRAMSCADEVAGPPSSAPRATFAAYCDSLMGKAL